MIAGTCALGMASCAPRVYQQKPITERIRAKPAASCSHNTADCQSDARRWKILDTLASMSKLSLGTDRMVIRDPAAIPLLVQLLKNRCWAQHHDYALQGLLDVIGRHRYTLDDRQLRLPLQVLVKNIRTPKTKSIRLLSEKVLVSIAKAGLQPVQSAMFNLLASSDSDVRLSAIRVLGAVGNARAIERLRIICRNDPDQSNRMAAQTAMGDITTRLHNEAVMRMPR